MIVACVNVDPVVLVGHVSNDLKASSVPIVYSMIKATNDDHQAQNKLNRALVVVSAAQTATIEEGGAKLSRKNCDDSRGSRNAVEYREIDGFVEGQGWSSRSLEEKFSSFLSSSDIAQSPRFILAYMSHPKHASIHYSESSNLSEIGRVKK